ncbi:MAG TPA: SMP-30/gluconolactonase/LRE family protein [Caulobacterales bacterium]|nr:SMP-30/gluconolactonase/LRE family protein [Caulobacterales bacterium]
MEQRWTRRSVMAAGAAAAALSACAHHPLARPALGGVRRIRPELDELIAADAVVEEIGDGYTWAEGPIWVRGHGFLLFNDVPGNTMYEWNESSGVTRFMHPSGYAGTDTSFLREGGANGMNIDRSGRLLIADSGNRCIARYDFGRRRREVLVDRFEGKRFNSPNDVITHRNGAIYFTDPPYGLAGIEASPLRETPWMGVYRLDPSGAIAMVDDKLSFPNGIAFSPDYGTLYVSCSDPRRPIIMAYSLDDGGVPTSSRVFFNAAPLMADDAPGLPDGMTIDYKGNLFASGPGGIMIISPDGVLLGMITAGAGRPIANCKFGEDGKTLFLTAQHKVARVRTLTHWI